MCTLTNMRNSVILYQMEYIPLSLFNEQIKYFSTLSYLFNYVNSLRHASYSEKNLFNIIFQSRNITSNYCVIFQLVLMHSIACRFLFIGESKLRNMTGNNSYCKLSCMSMNDYRWLLILRKFYL